MKHVYMNCSCFRDREIFVISEWFVGEPTGANAKESEDCMALANDNSRFHGFWFDMSCFGWDSGRVSVICEKPAKTEAYVATPSTTAEPSTCKTNRDWNQIWGYKAIRLGR